MKARHLGIFGIISLLSYGAMVFLSPLAYPGYDPLSMAISDLSAVGAPSAALAERLNALYGPAAVVNAMAVCVGASACRSKFLKAGIGLFAAMEWISTAGYRIFPLVMGEDIYSFQSVMHILVTVLVVALSILSLVLILAGGRREGITSLSRTAGLCLFCMLAGALGTGLMPKRVFGLFERLSAFSAVVFNAFLGFFLWTGRFPEEDRDIQERSR